MIAHLDALAARLAEIAPVYIGEAEARDGAGSILTGRVPEVPYLLLWTGAGTAGDDLPVCGPHGSLAATVNVTCVAGTPRGAVMLATSVRESLTPGFGHGALAVTNRHVTLSHVDSRPVQVDRDVRITDTNTHPAYVVEIFGLDSQPA